MSTDITKKKTLMYGLNMGIESVKYSIELFEKRPSQMHFEMVEDSMHALLEEMAVLRKTLEDK